MAKKRIALAASAMIGTALLCGTGMAKAQDYDYGHGAYYGPGNDGQVYDDRVGPPSETIIVHPNDVIEERQILAAPAARSIRRNIRSPGRSIFPTSICRKARIARNCMTASSRRRAICALNSMRACRG